MKINLEFENLEELDMLLTGINMGLYLLGQDTYARMICCKSEDKFKDKCSLKEQKEYYKKLKELYSNLDIYYNQMKKEEGK